jgi:serine/threonine-protein kinase PknG
MLPHCRQPGCDGRIEDDYCNVCGTPANAAPPPARPASGTGAAASGTGTAASAGPSSGAAGTAAGVASATQSFRMPAVDIGSERLPHGATGRTRRIGAGSTRTRRAALGAGLTSVPEVEVADPATVVMQDPEVAEGKRFCSSCGKPVGRSREGRPGRAQGFCSQCRAPYSFTPKLGPGDLVGGQYQVAGCLAHGGLGWVYLARDRNVSDRWVVLKGLLNAGDADAYQAAIAERQFLAQVEHPLIVEIYNFVMHDGAGYIVMEYVGGKSIKNLLKDRMTAAGAYDAIPVDQAIAYVLEVLPAFGYLHDLGLLYCDFKPDNLIQYGDNVKLIDLGGVRRADDQVSAIYGTVGYQAPEVPTLGPSVAGDIYTVGRTLAVMVMEFRGYQSRYVDSLPDPDDAPVLAEHESLYRLLLKACAKNPDDRFSTAEELRGQLFGVLREVVGRRAPAAQTSVASALFETLTVSTGSLGWADLPALRVDPADPGAAWLAALTVTEPVARLHELQQAPTASREIALARGRAAIEASSWSLARQTLAAVLQDDPWEWRAVWLTGICDLAQQSAADAAASFNAVYEQLPGELAPKLALALACEQAGRLEAAERLYRTCLRTDAAYLAAAFGLSRVHRAQHRPHDAVAALELVPGTSRAFTPSRRAQVEILVSDVETPRHLDRALHALDGLNLQPLEKARLRVRALHRALDLVTGKNPPAGGDVGGVPLREKDVRLALENGYRALARLTEDRTARTTLVETANRVRPVTWL